MKLGPFVRAGVDVRQAVFILPCKQTCDPDETPVNWVQSRGGVLFRSPQARFRHICLFFAFTLLSGSLCIRVWIK